MCFVILALVILSLIMITIFVKSIFAGAMMRICRSIGNLLRDFTNSIAKFVLGGYLDEDNRFQDYDFMHYEEPYEIDEFQRQ